MNPVEEYIANLEAGVAVGGVNAEFLECRETIYVHLRNFWRCLNDPRAAEKMRELAQVLLAKKEAERMLHD